MLADNPRSRKIIHIAVGILGGNVLAAIYRCCWLTIAERVG
jgi:hypothetical protein